MFEAPSTAGLAKPAAYRQLNAQLSALFADESDWLANAANLSALLFQLLPELNWAGFYFLRGQTLVLGPFQGKVACVRIELGRGVCGTAAERRQTVVVPDVHAFPGHIACDAASRSEIVLPLLSGERLLAGANPAARPDSGFDSDSSGRPLLMTW
jgi:L-methionine (R)-S-oxide reductase